MQTYELTLDPGTPNERKALMTLDEFKAYNERRKREAMSKFDADCRAAGLRNPFSNNA